MRQPKAKTQSRGIPLNNFQISALAVAFNKEFITIQRWASKNHYALSTPAARRIIKEYEKLPQIQLISE